MNKERWDLAMQKQVSLASQKFRHHQKMLNPWYRALTTCAQAQAVRSKRFQEMEKSVEKHHAETEKDWGSELQKEIKRLEERIRAPQPGTWEYALKIRKLSLDHRRQEQRT